MPLHSNHHHLCQDHRIQVMHGHIREVHISSFFVLKTAALQYFVMNVCRKICYKYLHTNFFLRSQILFLLVFLTRYMDVFTHFISMYNTSIKIFFIISTTTNIYLVFVKYAGTISSDMDTFRYVVLSLKSRK